MHVGCIFLLISCHAIHILATGINVVIEADLMIL